MCNSFARRALVLATLTGATQAQGYLWTFPSESPGPIVATGDLNGDGLGDYLVGDPRGSNLDRPGIARAHSGRNGSVLWELHGTTVNDELGGALAVLGDLDGDGASELAIGAGGGSGFQPNLIGRVAVVSGRSGAQRYALLGKNPGDPFGSVLTALGDVDGDGAGDFAIGVPWSAAKPDGYVEIVSGAAGAVLRALSPPVAGLRFGTSVERHPDADADGADDVLVGQPGGDAAHLFSSATAGVLQTLLGTPGSGFGESVSPAGDVDDDGTTDVIVGASAIVHGLWTTGSAFVYSGATWALLQRVDAQPNEISIGARVGAYGDLDGDGFDDFVVQHTSKKAGGCCAFALGQLRIHSGLDGSELASDSTGLYRAIGDLNADGRGDYVLGGIPAGVGSAFNYVVLIGLASPSPWCYGAAGSPEGCKPALTSSGAPSLTIGPNMTFHVDKAPSDRRGMMIWGTQQQYTPFGSGVLCVAPPIVRMPLGNSGGTGPCGGTFVQPFTKDYMTQHGLTPGTSVHVQYFGFGTAGTSGFALSDSIWLFVWP